MNKMSQIKAAVCLPLYQAAPDTVMKKEDLMDDTEKRYLNKKNPDFQRTISDGKSAMRKEEEWTVQQAVEEGLLTRIERGYYTITPAGRCWLEDFSAEIMAEEAEISQQAILTKDAIDLLQNIFQEHESDILARQAASIFSQL